MSTSKFTISVIVLSFMLPCVSLCYGAGAINEINAIRARSTEVYECAVQFHSDDIERVQMTMPWGYIFDSDNFLPADWAGEDFDDSVNVSDVEYQLETYKTDGLQVIDLFCEFESTTLWDMLDATDVTVTVTYTDQTTWTGSLDFSNCNLPGQIPVIHNPANYDTGVDICLFFEWDQWQNPDMNSSICLGVWEETTGDDVMFRDDITTDVTQWDVIDTLKEYTDYNADLYFYNDSATSVVNGVNVTYLGGTYQYVEFQTGGPHIIHQRGIRNGKYSLGLIVRVGDIEQLEVTTPWGTSFNSADHFPADWNGGLFVYEEPSDDGQTKLSFIAYKDDSEVEFEIGWNFESETYWTAIDNSNMQVTINRSENPTWNESLNASGIILPSQPPVFTYPQDQQSSAWRRPTLQWQEWVNPPAADHWIECGVYDPAILVGIAEAGDLSSGTTEWTLPVVLEANRNYAAWISFDVILPKYILNGIEIEKKGQAGIDAEFTTGVSTAMGPDLNSDNNVDIGDLAILAMHWMSDESSVDIAPEGGDGSIDLLDFAELVSNWKSDEISDHVFDVLIESGFEYDQVSSLEEYAFVLELETDATVDMVEFTTPDNETFEITDADETVTPLPNGEILTERYYNSDTGLYEWVYEVESTDEDEVAPYGDGEYTIKVYYTNGSSHETAVSFLVPGTSNPISQPMQDPHMTTFAHGDTLTSPVTFAWIPCTDPVANQISFCLENRAGGDYIIDEVLALSATSLPEPHSLAGEWEAWIGFKTLYTGQNNDGINFEVDKYCDRGFQFTMESQ